MMNVKGLRLGVVTLIAGGALTGGLLFGGALVSAQTPDTTPATEEDETPADSTTPQVTPDADETPADSTDDADQGDTEDEESDVTPSDEDRPARDGACDKDGDGQRRQQLLRQRHPLQRLEHRPAVLGSQQSRPSPTSERGGR